MNAERDAQSAPTTNARLVAAGPPSYAPTPLPPATAASRKRLRADLESLVYENNIAHARSVVDEWLVTENFLARSLVRMALFAPVVFTSVEAYEGKLHRALSHGLWVNDREKTAHPLTKRNVSKIVAFVASVAGEKKNRTLVDIVSTSASVRCDNSANEMYALLHGVGFYNVRPLDDWKQEYELMQRLRQTYAFKPSLGPSEILENEAWWNDAVSAAVGPTPRN